MGERPEPKQEVSLEAIQPDRTLDAIGFFCPEPVLKTRKEIEKMIVGQVLEVMADDPGSAEDIPKWANRAGQQFLKMSRENHHFRFLVKKVK